MIHYNIYLTLLSSEFPLATIMGGRYDMVHNHNVRIGLAVSTWIQTFVNKVVLLKFAFFRPLLWQDDALVTIDDRNISNYLV